MKENEQIIYIEINLTERHPNLSMRIPITKDGKSKKAIPSVSPFLKENETK